MPGFWRTVRELVRAPDERPLLPPDRQGHGRSLRLLVSNLTPEQRRQFARYDYFDVIGCDTGTRYRIQNGRSLNVAQLNASGGRMRMLCFEPQGTLPVGDVMLAQKIALELFELEAISVANASAMLEHALGLESRRSGRRFARHR
jgi:hypothetical protein